MKALLERLSCPVAIVRVGETLEKHGDPYEWSVVLVWYDGLDAPPTVCGLDKHPIKAGLRAFERMLLEEGIPLVRYERRRSNGQVETFEMTAQEFAMPSAGTTYRVTLKVDIVAVDESGVEHKFADDWGGNWHGLSRTDVQMLEREFLGLIARLNEQDSKKNK